MSFTFNGRSCEDFGLVVEKYPPRQTPEKLFDTYQVPGLSGKVFVPRGAFSNVLQPYEVFVKGGSTALQPQISNIAAWLLGPNEPKDLTDTYDADTIRKAVFAGGVSWANSLNKYGKCTLTFDCAPQRYDAVPQTVTGTIPGGASYAFVIGNGTPKGGGYIDDIIPFMQFWPDGTISATERIWFTITNNITGESTSLTLECTAAMSSAYEIILDMLKGTLYVRNRTSGAVYDILTFFDVSITGTLKMRFTYQATIDVVPELTNLKYNVDPRWYKL